MRFFMIRGQNGKYYIIDRDGVSNGIGLTERKLAKAVVDDLNKQEKEKIK